MGVDLVTTNEVPIGAVCDIGTSDVKFTPLHLGIRVVDEPTFTRTRSWRLGRVEVPAWKGTSHSRRVDLRGHGGDWGGVYPSQSEAQ